jgi:hypothetical protein
MLRLAAPVPRCDISVVANKQLQNIDVTVCSALHESSVSSGTRKYIEFVKRRSVENFVMILDDLLFVLGVHICAELQQKIAEFKLSTC